MNLANILIILLYIYLMVCKIEDNTNLQIMLTVLFLIVLMYNKKNKVIEFYTNNDLSNKPIFPGFISDDKHNYNNLCLETGNPEEWAHSPTNIPLISNDALYTIQGTESPYYEYKTDNSDLPGPPVDGESGPNNMFMFSNNIVSPNCCPSMYTTSDGCVCTTDKQREFVNTRGHNRDSIDLI